MDIQNSENSHLVKKLGYAMGDTAANLAWRPLIAFLPIFYTDTFGLSAAVVAFFTSLCRIFDGFVDVTVGAFADRTETKWGKFRPWLLWTAVPFGLLFSTYFHHTEFSLSGKLIWGLCNVILAEPLYILPPTFPTRHWWRNNRKCWGKNQCFIVSFFWCIRRRCYCPWPCHISYKEIWEKVTIRWITNTRL